MIFRRTRHLQNHPAAREDARPPTFGMVPVSLMEGERPREPVSVDEVLQEPRTCQNMNRRVKLRRLVGITALAGLAILALLCGPAADRLQMRGRLADPTQPWDAVYLVCGARAQQRRLRALTAWVARAPLSTVILVGNDPQPSLWSREHQRNLTRTEWGVEALEVWKRAQYGEDAGKPVIHVVPGVFSNTDGEMQALADYLRGSPYQRVALVTSRFHARRVLERLEAHAPDNIEFAIVQGTPYWENRAPWIVAGEYLKRLRDRLGQSQTPLLTRPHDGV